VIWDAFERITAGFADAAEVRIGFRMGAGQPRKARLAAFKALFMALIVSLFLTGVLFIIAGELPRWLTPDPTLRTMVNTTGCLYFESFPLCLRVSHGSLSFHRFLKLFRW